MYRIPGTVVDIKSPAEAPMRPTECVLTTGASSQHHVFNGQ